MEIIHIKDKDFKVSIPEEEILKQVDRVAAEINRDLAGKNPLFLAVLNGSFMFASDLMKRIIIPCEISFVKLATYSPESVQIATLLVKPEKLKVDLDIKYAAINIPNDFIVGYGLDYDGFGRNYKDIYTVVD